MKLRTPENGDLENIEWLIERGTKTRNGLSGTSKERNFNPKFYPSGELNHLVREHLFIIEGYFRSFANSNLLYIFFLFNGVELNSTCCHVTDGF